MHKITRKALTRDRTDHITASITYLFAKIHNSSLDTSHFARNLGFIFDEHPTFSNQITSLAKACYYHIRQLRCIRPYLDSSSACVIATSIVHSKLDYSNSLYYKLPKSHLSRLQHIQNSLARTRHTTAILRSPHWIKITERVEHKLLSLTYKVITTTQLPYLHNLISVQRPRSTCSSFVVTLARPPLSSSLQQLIALFVILYLVSGTDSRYLLVNLILVPVPVPPFPTHLFLHPSLLTFLIHHSAHP